MGMNTDFVNKKEDIIMPELKCTVQTCTHNQNFYCHLDSIVVGGILRQRLQMRHAVTALRSEKHRGWKIPIRMHIGHGKKHLPRVAIDCKATDCMYNEECKCHAGKISVEGGNACHCQETECATFKCGCVIFGRKDAQVICIRSVNKRYR